MKPHHEYQIYYGGWKDKRIGYYVCLDCDKVVKKNHKKQSNNVSIKSAKVTPLK